MSSAHRTIPLLILGIVVAGCTSPSPNEIEWQNAQLACAQLGIPPASSEIGSCATSLQMRISRINHSDP